MVGLLPEQQKDGAWAARLRSYFVLRSRRWRQAHAIGAAFRFGIASDAVDAAARESRARESQGRFTQDFDDFLAVPGCASGPHWTGEGEPPVIEEIISMSEEGFDLG